MPRISLSLVAWSALLVLHAHFHIFTEADEIFAPKLWELVNEDLQEYSLQRAAFPERNRLECLALWIEEAVDAVGFDESEKMCRLYSCRWGRWGCRKCRNLRRADGQPLWVRRLNHLGRRICWRTFQHRVDGTVLFNRSWHDFQVGFGQGEQLNYWMGLDALHEATKDGLRRVRWELSTWSGEPFWAENEHFLVDGPAEKYRLSLGPLDTARSTLGMDDLTDTRSANNKSFTTYDSDNDEHNKRNCAQDYHSGWWFGNCFWFNPNGRYIDFEATAPGETGGPAMVYTFPGSTYPFLLWYSHRTYECLFAEFV